RGAGCASRGRRRDQVVPRSTRALQVPDVRRLGRRAAAQPIGEDPQARAARALLGRARPTGLTAASAAAELRGALLSERGHALARVGGLAEVDNRLGFVCELLDEIALE